LTLCLFKKKDRTQKKACKAWIVNIGEGNDVTSDPYGNHSRSTFGMLDGQNSLFISGKILFLILTIEEKLGHANTGLFFFA